MPFRKQLFLLAISFFIGLSGAKALSDKTDKAINKKANNKARKSEVKKESKKSFKAKPALSGLKKNLITSELKRFTSPVPNEKEIDYIISTYLQEKPQRNELVCPSGYDLKNDYSLYGEIDFISLKKGSCLGEEAKETYSLNRKWIVEKKDKKNLMSAYEKILKWQLDLFFFPYLPASFRKKPKEFKEYKLGQACPSCSFRFEYHYKYHSAGFVDFDVKALCVDKKHTFSKVKHDSYLLNNWRCIKKASSVL